MKTKLIKDRRLRDLSYTLGANIVSLLSGLVATFVIPTLLSIEQYAYLRVFILYLGYVGLFHFGFNDGIYINYGKYDYEHLPKQKFRTYFKFLSLFQACIAALMLAISAVFAEDRARMLIYIFLSLNIILVNIISYFDFLSQFVRRFNIYSANLVLSKILYILGVAAFLFVRSGSGLYFVVLQTIVNIIILFIYLWKYRDIVFGKSEAFKDAEADIKNSFSIGFFIMLGNFIASLIIGIDRIFVDNFFSVKDFAIYSFAVSLLSMFYLLLNAISSVVYPYLTRSEGKNRGKTYEIMKSVIFIVLGFALSGYFIFEIIVRTFIPKYVDSLSITAIIFPTILLSGQINIITQNHYKILKLQKQFTRNNIISLIITVTAIGSAFIFFKTVNAIAAASLISFYLWELYGDTYFKKQLGFNAKRHHIGELSAIAVFIYLTYAAVWYAGFLIYIAAFAAIVFILFKKDIKEIRNIILKRS